MAVLVQEEVVPTQRDGEGESNVAPAERVASVVVGGGLLVVGARRRTWPGWLLALLGGGLVQRGLTGRSRLYSRLGLGTRAGQERTVHQRVTLQQPREQVYRFLRDFQNHAHFMHRVESVHPLPDGVTRWQGARTHGHPLEWVTAVTQEVPNVLLAWRTVEPTPPPLEHAGELRLGDAPGGRGTELHATVRYRLRPGKAARQMERLLGASPGQVMAEELRRLRQLLEAGEISTTTGQPQGPRSLLGRAALARAPEEVR